MPTVRKRRGQKAEARRLYGRAYDLELEVANRTDPDRSLLGWSIMMRSAASLAFLSGQMRTAERLACSTLAGEPHTEIIHELRDLLETIYLQPDDPAETDRVLETVHSAIDRAVADGSASPISYTETYDEVDYQPGRPGFIVGIGEEEGDGGLRGHGPADLWPRTSCRGRGQRGLIGWERAASCRPPVERRVDFEVQEDKHRPEGGRVAR